MREWKDLEWRVVGWSWEWLCPTCHGLLRKDPWTPPTDMPQPLRSPESVRTDMASVGVHRAVWSAR